MPNASLATELAEAGANKNTSGSGCGRGSPGKREVLRTGRSVNPCNFLSSPKDSSHRLAAGVNVIANCQPNAAAGSAISVKNRRSISPQELATKPNTRDI